MAGQWVAGVDGAQKGWVVACIPITGSDEASLFRCETFQEVKAKVVELGCSSVGVDMPIGVKLSGSRQLDSEARQRLGARRSSLFPTPSSVVLEATSYEDALIRSRNQPGKGFQSRHGTSFRKYVKYEASSNLKIPTHFLNATQNRHLLNS